MKLSEEIDKKFYQEYPDYAESQTNRSKLQFLYKRNRKFVGLLSFFVITVFLNEIGTQNHLILWYASITEDNVADVLSSSLEYLGGLLGIIIPVIFLVAEVVSHNNEMGSILDIVFEQTKVRHTSAYALVTLGIELILLGILKTGIMIEPHLLFYTLYAIVLMNLLILFKIGLIIFSIKKIFNRDYLLESLFRRVSTDINVVLAEDAKNRIGRQVFREYLEHLGFEKRYTFNPIPTSMKPLKLRETGFIVDIQLSNLKQFSDQFKADERPIFIRGIYDHITPNETVAYIPFDTDERLAQERIQSVFQIGMIEKTNHNLPRLLDQLQWLARKDLLNKNPNSFYSIFEYYTELIVESGLFERPKSVKADKDTDSWSYEQLNKDMRALIKLAAKEDNSTDFLEIILDQNQQLARRFINPSVSEKHLHVLENVLAYFDDIYRYSFRHKNEYGVQNSPIYLEALLADWANQVNKHLHSPECVDKLIPVFHKLYYCMEALLMYAFANQDFNTISVLFRMMNPTLLKDNQSIFDRESKAEYQAWHSSYTPSAASLTTPQPSPQIESFIRLHNLEREMDGVFDLFPFIILGWAIEQYELHKISLDRFQEIWELTVPHIPDLERRLTYLSTPYTEVERWFEDVGKFHIDARDLMYLACFFVSMKDFEYAQKICPTVIKNINMKQIRIIRDQIYHDQRKWWSLLALQEEEFIERLDLTVELYERASRLFSEQE